MSISVNSVSHRVRNTAADAGIGLVAGGLVGAGVGKVIGVVTPGASHAAVMRTAFKGAGIGVLAGAAAFILADDAISNLKGRPISAALTGGLGAATGAAAGAAIGSFTPIGTKPGAIVGTALGALLGSSIGGATGIKFPGSSNNIVARTAMGAGGGVVGGAILGAVLGATGFKKLGVAHGAIWGAAFGVLAGAGYGALNVGEQR